MLLLYLLIVPVSEPVTSIFNWRTCEKWTPSVAVTFGTKSACISLYSTFTILEVMSILKHPVVDYVAWIKIYCVQQCEFIVHQWGCTAVLLVEQVGHCHIQAPFLFHGLVMLTLVVITALIKWSVLNGSGLVFDMLYNMYLICTCSYESTSGLFTLVLIVSNMGLLFTSVSWLLLKKLTLLKKKYIIN